MGKITLYHGTPDKLLRQHLAVAMINMTMDVDFI